MTPMRIYSSQDNCECGRDCFSWQQTHISSLHIANIHARCEVQSLRFFAIKCKKNRKFEFVHINRLLFRIFFPYSNVCNSLIVRREEKILNFISETSEVHEVMLHFLYLDYCHFWGRLCVYEVIKCRKCDVRLLFLAGSGGYYKWESLRIVVFL